METRTDAHYDTISGLLTEATAEGSQSEPGTVSEDTWDDIMAESDSYTMDMTHLLEDLGKTVTDFGDCQMTMGGLDEGRHDDGRHDGQNGCHNMSRPALHGRLLPGDPGTHVSHGPA